MVDPGGAKKRPELVLDYVANIENAARVIEALHAGKKRLVFVDSRRKAERLGKLLGDRGLAAYVMHGSLSVRERREAEQAFADGSDCVIVATSAMELGIDIGDLDHVLQIDSPPNVASFLQRMGRTGRRAETTPNCTFLATTNAGALQAAAILELHSRGYVEPVSPRTAAFHIYAHQAMALAVQNSGLPRGEIDTWLTGAVAFRDAQPDDRGKVLDHMLNEQILSDQDGKIWLGTVGEDKYARANFRELYAVFSSPRLINVRANRQEIGQVEALFLSTLESPEGYSGASFTLGGRAWQVQHIDWERGWCIVTPAPAGKPPRWNGGSRWLSYDLCQAMRAVLVSDELHDAWSERARATLTTERADYAFLREDPSPLIEDRNEITWWNFAGGGANLILAQLIEHELGEKVVVRNTSMTLSGEAGKSMAAVRETLRKFAEEARPTNADALRFAEGAKRGRLSKFEPCLPDELLQRFFADTVLDLEGAQRAVAGCFQRKPT